MQYTYILELYLSRIMKITSIIIMISNKTQITVTAITTKNIGNSFESKRIKIKHIVTAGLYVHVCGIMCTACYIYNRDGMILY